MSGQGRGVSRRSLLAAGLGAIGAAALGGCATRVDAAIADDTAVNFTSWIFGLSSSAHLVEAVAGYEQRTGVEVRRRTYPYDQYLNQLVLKTRGGHSTGLVHIDEEWMSTLATAGVLADLGDLVDEQRYPEHVCASGRYRGVRYAMPWTQSAIGIVANTGLATEVGVDVDRIRTVDDFTTALRAIKRADPSLIPYLPCTNVVQLKDIIPWMWSFGATVVDGGVITLGDAGSLAALEYWKMLLDEELIQAGVVRDDARTLFAQQRAVFYDDAPQSIKVVPPQSSDPDIAAKMRPLPRPSVAGTGRNLVWSQPLVALSRGHRVDELLTYLSADEQAQRIAFEKMGQPPTTTTSLTSPWFTGNRFHAEWNRIVAAASATNPFWAFPRASAAQLQFDESIERGLRGSVSAAQALREAKDGLQEQLTSL